MRHKIVLKNLVFSREINTELLKLSNQYKSKYIEESLKKKFLFAIKEKKAEIKAFRSRWNIHPGGFATETAINKWGTKKKKSWNTKLNLEEFTKEVHIYKSYGLILDEVKTITKEQPTEISKNKLYDFDTAFFEAIKKLAREIELDYSWVKQLRYYLLHRDDQMLGITDCGIKIFKTSLKDVNGKYFDGKIILEIGPNTRREDLIFIWGHNIEPLQKTLTGRIDISGNRKI